MKLHIAEELRNICRETKENHTPILNLKDIRARILDCSVNPYISMFDMALMTWADCGHKWNHASPELRFEVVKGVLDRRALPLALEAPSFTFLIENCSRACFDQIARARIGVVFAARGYKDDYLNGVGFCLPSKLDNNWFLAQEVTELVEKCKEMYSTIQKKYPNWVARCILPMYSQYHFIMSMTYSALQGLCANRMQTTEMEETVAIAWLLREEVNKKFPLLAHYLRPQCDITKKDTTYSVNGFSKELGVPHLSDNRQPGYDYDMKPEFIEPCTDIKSLEESLGITIPKPTDWRDLTWEDLSGLDRDLFTK